ncbi:MAG: SLBB domain-containing protein [Rickettsiales bacterium]|nr:SLBB domain-containing protein [Rickettsiales bacterium]
MQYLGLIILSLLLATAPAHSASAVGTDGDALTVSAEHTQQKSAETDPIIIPENVDVEPKEIIEAAILQDPPEPEKAMIPELIIQAGDILYIALPGEEGFNAEFQVNRAGHILLPEIGEISLEGQTMADATVSLREKLGEMFRDLEQLTLQLKKRGLIVTVLGYVKKPGTVTLPLEANLQTAIAKAGGLKPGAQLDRVQLQRDGKTIKINYKAYLDSGDSSLLETLVSRDVIFVPVSPLLGNVQIEFDARTLMEQGDASEETEAIQIMGEVHNPGTFAYKEDASAFDMLMRAGGVTRYAGAEQIRIIHQGVPHPFNLKRFMDTADRKFMPDIAPGDIIFVPQKEKGIKTGNRTVYVMGEVHKPGAFEIQGDIGFFHILSNAGGPTRFADTRKLQIIRPAGVVESFDLFAFTQDPKSITVPTVTAGDAILIPHKTRSNENSWLNTPPQKAVQILGAVNKPGRYEWSNEMTLFDLIGHAGGPKLQADMAHLEIVIPQDDGSSKSQRFDVESAIKNGYQAEQLPQIVGGTVVMVPELPNDPSDNKSQWIRQAPESSIYIFGQVNSPGRYAFNPDFSFLDIISAANGPTAGADMRNIRVNQRKRDGKNKIRHVNLTLYFEKGDESLLPDLHTEDVIYVPERNPNWLDLSKEDSIRVMGEIRKPGRYRFEDGMTILDLLAEAGGPTGAAYQEKIIVVNFSDSKDQARMFDLVSFAKSGDFSALPLVKAGDTVYVPNIAQSEWKQFMGGVGDIVQLLSIPALLGGL